MAVKEKIFELLGSFANSGPVFLFILIVLVLLLIPMDVNCLSDKYPTDIPKGYSAQKTKYRVIEWDNRHSMFAISDANKISINSESIIIYPPIFVQEWMPLAYGNKWERCTIQKKYETIFVMDNISVIRTVGGKIAIPKKGNKDTSPFGNFRATLLATDKLLSHRVFIDVFKSKNPMSKGILKVMATEHFVSLPRADKISIMQSSWKLWANIYKSSRGEELILAFVDRNNKLLGYAKGEEVSSIVLP